jgi:hypothetical protein
MQIQNISARLLFTLLVTFMYSESSAQFSYFPLSVGNKWFFSYGLDNRIHYKLEIEKDTVLSDGYSYAKVNKYFTNNDSVFTLYTNGFSYLRNADSAIIEYPHYTILKYKMNVGDSAITCGKDSNKLKMSSVLTGVDRVSIFGKDLFTYTFSFTQYDYYSFSDSIGFNTLWATTWNNWIPEYLLGCVIDGRVYGKAILTEVTNKVQSIHKYVLDQNYPNPFNPLTTISFYLSSKTFVSLKVYDLIGREISTLVYNEMSAGNHLEQWNASNKSSGVYFYRLQAGSFTDTKRLILLR